MGTLEPIGDAVPEDHRAFAEALRTLFDSLGISLRRYAARCYTDAGTLSRYLKGTRIPPWNFVVNLLAHVAEEREIQTSDETVALLRQLYVRAAKTSAGTKRAADLQRLLEEADEQVREATSLERLLRQALHESQQHVDQLNVELKALRAVRAADRQAAKAEIDLFTSEADELRAERDQLQADIAILKKQLADATSARILAEERCDQLERQIESAENEEKDREKTETSQEAEVVITTQKVRAAADTVEEQRAAREFAEAREQMAAAQEHIAALQAELTAAKQEKLRERLAHEAAEALRHNLVSASPEEEATGRASRSLAVRVGYGPDQVLRRLDVANRVSPEDVRPILARAFDLQSKDEVERTRRLLQVMPSRVRRIFSDIVAHSTKGTAAQEEQRLRG
ncbi:hypothetical protein SGFS_071600 [Streptomyces graminofaciens]|uniref:Chromosome partition protein Smc n=1 Tax=Streptomyces graminofaciens TaxID=68212 RepID=A0ABM7FFL1_9ACTN|nr:hypothetical protein [Streptomyces graminofaciens]BBC35866.1 hypothetical protein SGFS_071600 [Streptomyces graminofaciens]